MERERPHLSFAGGSLKIGGIPARILSEKYGTPLYVTDLDRVGQRYEAANTALSSRYRNILVAFAYKSNSTRDVVNLLSRKCAGATVVSMFGLELAIASGVEAHNIIFDGPSKTKEELAAALRAGVGMINAESIQEVEDIESLCAHMHVKSCKLGFRINFDLHADTHAGLATGGSGHKFGIAREEVVQFCKTKAPRLKRVRLAGLHCHVGSQINNPAPFRKLTEEMVALGDELEQEGIEIHEFNLGGGLAAHYGWERRLEFDEYAEATAGTFARLRGDRRSKDLRLVFELGRSIIADSTVLLTRVNYVKRVGGRWWALVDAGMNDFLRPSLYGAFHAIVPAYVGRQEPSNVAYNIGGPVCESTDVFGTDRKLGLRLSPGDVLAVLDTGAYGVSMASHYNMRPVPPVVVVSRGMHRLALPDMRYPLRRPPGLET